MITLVKNGVYMEVGTEQLASLFERNGYVRVGTANIEEEVAKPEKVEEPKPIDKPAEAEEPVKEEEPEAVEPIPEPTPAKPKRRTRRKATAE